MYLFRKRGKRIICLCLCMALLSGCGEVAPQAQVVQESTTVQTVQLPVYKTEITYELPSSRVRVLVDRGGYLKDREKRVVFLGEDLAEEFRIVKEDTKETVYSGVITKTAYDKESGEVVSRGDFTDFTQEGTYYIETDRIGRSYTFIIGNNAYDSLFGALMEEEQHFIHEESAQGICNLGLGMHAMLLALQCHGAVFEQNKTLVPQLLEAADWMLTVQDNKTGSIYEDYEATAVFCGIMAMYTNIFGKYDEKAAKSYLAASKRAWNWLDKQQAGMKQQASARFYAAAQLFRAEGSSVCHTAVLDYLKEHELDVMEDKYAFYGIIVYLGTERKTDRDICTELMQELVNETESICLTSRKDCFSVYSRDLGANLYKLMVVSFVDYITPSNEYATVMENTIHYIEGRNEDGSCYIGSDGVWLESDKTAKRTPEWNGILLFCLSDLLDQEDN